MQTSRVTFFNVLIAVAIMFTQGIAPRASAESSGEFEGIYAGLMDIQVGFTQRQVPIQISLVLTGETVNQPNGDILQVIDGAFLIDGEGGAYPFNEVGFDLADFSLDMRYSRPTGIFGDQVPANFRLVGEYMEDDSIEGRVLSGSRGPVGTFKVRHIDSPIFQRSISYAGNWNGQAEVTGGGEIPMQLSLLDAQGSTTNPPGLEFDYTPGKLGYLRWNQLNLSIREVTIDYLTGVVNMRQAGTSGTDLSVEFSIDPISGNAVGIIKSANRGQVATFDLPVNF